MVGGGIIVKHRRNKGWAKVAEVPRRGTGGVSEKNCLEARVESGEFREIKTLSGLR